MPCPTVDGGIFPDLYVKDVSSKVCDSQAVPTIEKETVATALINGNNGLGAVVGNISMDLAIQKAKTVGIGWVVANSKHFFPTSDLKWIGPKNNFSFPDSNHYGIAGYYSLQAMKSKLIVREF